MIFTIQVITGGPKWPTSFTKQLQGTAGGYMAAPHGGLGAMASSTTVLLTILPPATPAAGRDFDHNLGNSAAETFFHCLQVADWPTHFAWQG